jgi:hypothetical protein
MCHALYLLFCRSQHEDLDLVDVETFYEEAPTDISCPVGGWEPTVMPNSLHLFSLLLLWLIDFVFDA